MIDYADPDFRRDAETLLALAVEKDVGVMIIKSVAKEPWGDRGKKLHALVRTL